MNKEAAAGLFFIALLFGGVLLLARRPTVVTSHAIENYSQGNIRVVPISEPAHYRNKETRRLEYNADGQLTLMEITRDYTVA